MKKRKVLVVDDSSTIRKIIQHSLRRANLNVGDILEASNGCEALGLVQRFTFDLILTDIDMRPMDGLELLEALAYVRSAQSTPVVVHLGRRRAAGDGGRGQGLPPQALYCPGPFRKD